MYLCVCVCLQEFMCTMFVEVLTEARYWHPGTGILGSCEPPCGCWEPSSLQEYWVLLTSEPVYKPGSSISFGCLKIFLLAVFYFLVLFSFSSVHADFADRRVKGTEIILFILRHAFSFQGGMFFINFLNGCLSIMGNITK